MKILPLLLLLLLFNACNKNEYSPKPQSNSINKILPLGASRVEGGRPEYESYQYELWKDLKENNWTFDFIGTQSDDASYPDFEPAVAELLLSIRRAGADGILTYFAKDFAKFSKG